MINFLKEENNQPIDINQFIKHIATIDNKLSQYNKIKDAKKQSKAYLSAAQEAEEYYKNNNNIYGNYEYQGKTYPPQTAHDFYNCILIKIYYYANLDITDERLKNAFLKCKASKIVNLMGEHITDVVSKLSEESKEDEKSPEPSNDKPPVQTSQFEQSTFKVGDSVYYKKKSELGFFTVSKILPDGKMIIKDASGKELTVNMSSYAKKGQ